jgi:hypothetical protein
MRDKILRYILKHDLASFAELTRLLGAEAAGSFDLKLRPNLIMWSDVSASFGSTIGELKAANLITLEPIPAYLYLIDGGALELPIAKSLRDYVEPHWLPVALRLTSAGRKAARKAAETTETRAA